MDIKSVSFTESGNVAYISTDEGNYQLTRADFRAFAHDIIKLPEACELSELLPVYADENAAETLIFLDKKLKAINYAAYILGIGDKSEKMLRMKMRTKGFETPEIDAAFEILRKNGCLSDEDFCRRKCEIIANGKLYGRRRITSELLAKGFSYETVTKTLDAAEIDFEQNAKELYMRLTKGKKPQDRESKKKLFDKLIRYGYDFDTARQAMADENSDEYSDEEYT